MNILEEIDLIDKNYHNEQKYGSSVTKVIEHIYKLAFDKKYDELNNLLLLTNKKSSKIMMVTMLRSSAPFKTKLSNWVPLKENCEEWLTERNEYTTTLFKGL